VPAVRIYFRVLAFADAPFMYWYWSIPVVDPFEVDATVTVTNPAAVAAGTLTTTLWPFDAWDITVACCVSKNTAVMSVPDPRLYPAIVTSPPPESGPFEGVTSATYPDDADDC
jgi:hypothetical protein